MNGRLRKKRLGLLFVVVAVMAAACVVRRPTPDQVTEASAGPYPENWETIVRDAFAQALLDPYSAVLRFDGPPRPGWMAKDVERKARDDNPGQWPGLLPILLSPFIAVPEYGWQVEGWVNAKNRFGAYTGPKRFIILIRDGRVVNSVGP